MAQFADGARGEGGGSCKLRMHQLERLRGAGTAAACVIALCHCRAAALLFPPSPRAAQRDLRSKDPLSLTSTCCKADIIPGTARLTIATHRSVCCCEYCVGPAYKLPAYRLYFKESAFPPPPPNLGTVVCRTRYSTVIMGTVCTGTVQYRTVLLYLWYLDLYEYSVVSQALRAPRVRVPRPARHVLLALRQPPPLRFYFGD